MLRVSAAVALLSIAVAHCRADDPTAPAPARSPRTERVADPRWQPKPGQQIGIPADNTPAARTYGAWDAYDAARRAHDVVGIDRQLSDGSLVKLAAATKVLVIRDHAPVPMGNGKLSSTAFESSRLNARPAEPTDGYPVEIRVMDGPHADKLAFVSRKDLARLVERRAIPALNPGDRATVAAPGSFMATDYNDLYDLKFAQIDGDGKVITGLLRDGKMARLNEASKVVVLGTDGEFARVRVHSGSKLAGLTGYIPAGDLLPPVRTPAVAPPARP